MIRNVGSLTIFVGAPKSRFKKMTILLKITRLWNLESFVKTHTTKIVKEPKRLTMYKMACRKQSLLYIFKFFFEAILPFCRHWQ